MGGEAKPLVDCTDDSLKKFKTPPETVLTIKGGHVWVNMITPIYNYTYTHTKKNR